MRLAALLVLVSGVAHAESVLGCQLPDNARKVAELRYSLGGDWERITKFFKEHYSKSSYPWKHIINQPGVKAFHIQNPSGKGWEGINVYEANDEIRVFVVPADSAKTKAKKPGKK